MDILKVLGINSNDLLDFYKLLERGVVALETMGRELFISNQVHVFVWDGGIWEVDRKNDTVTQVGALPRRTSGAAKWHPEARTR